MDAPHSPIVIIGASLAGLTLALACATRGVPVHVVERATRRVQGGDSLSVDLAMLATATDHDPRAQPALPVVPAYRDRHLVTWPALYDWLRGRAVETPGITLEEGSNVVALSDHGDRVELSFDGQRTLTAGAVIGADGYHSLVRRAVMPDAPLATYAGYLVWRGLIDEHTLARSIDWPVDGGLWIDFVDGYRLVAAMLPGRDGSLEPGKRQITFAWFDAHRGDFLRATGRLTDDGHLVGTLRSAAIGAHLRNELMALAPALWPSVWIEAVIAGLRSETALSGAPIAEYRPDRLAQGRLAIVGDAAHVVTPMTGSGYASGIEDAIVLATQLAQSGGDESVSAALARYESARLPYVRGLVAHSQHLSANYVRYANAGGQINPV